ncbi:WYL domain-containing protein [Vibrio sp. UCD-FRSSP16_10]|uniref:helix-turn-helix transcriptional regulator n=1 Tax=unclassified Vibrio TaxID=2614977 RepID=UPI000801C0BB|nr:MULTISPECIES: WYL domain-containing protein [unclassified Vibrio]OBT12135.1 WYL domain-containing protein [Vibrio sp. UCD-FRSSP16_30]OBT20466.1 WYL domain-containing protein [Vibrio sp. UCD-FRSSP16_10]
MSKTFERYQLVLQNIPCYPDHVTSIDLRQILLSRELLESALDEKSQMKTVQRVIAKIAFDYYAVEVDTDKRPHQIRIAQGHQHPINPAAMSSVLSLKVIEHEVLQMLPPTMRKEVANLISTSNSQLDKRTELWQQRFSYSPIEFQLTSPEFDESVIDHIEQAIIEQRGISITYQKRGSNQAQQYLLEPLGIALHGRSFYLIAMKEDTQQYRTFAIHRIANIKLGYSLTKPQTHFNAKHYIERHVPHFSGGEFIDVQLKIDNYHGLHLIEETKLSYDQTIVSKDEKHTIIKAKVRDSLGFEWWLMKNANLVEIIKPASIREKIIANLNKALQQYQ